VGAHITSMFTNLVGFFYRMVIVIPFSIPVYVLK
jgi:hypothetical protein